MDESGACFVRGARRRLLAAALIFEVSSGLSTILDPQNVPKTRSGREKLSQGTQRNAASRYRCTESTSRVPSDLV